MEDVDEAEACRELFEIGLPSENKGEGVGIWVGKGNVGGQG